MTKLTDVSLCAIDCAYPQLAARALVKSMKSCDFGEVILFTDAAVPGPFRTVHIDSLGSRGAYSHFVLKTLASHLSTSFALLVQWDGWVIAPHAWRDDFREYDYIGAVWPWHTDGMNVGNGGFSLRSAKLLDATAHADFQMVQGCNEDDLICRVHRSRLERQRRVRFAPEALAHRFSYERSAPSAPTYGFHGLFNMWRHVEDAEMTDIIETLGPKTLRSREAVELLLQYIALRKFHVATVLLSQFRRSMSLEEVRALARANAPDPGLADACVQACAAWARVA